MCMIQGNSPIDPQGKVLGGSDSCVCGCDTSNLHLRDRELSTGCEISCNNAQARSASPEHIHIKVYEQLHIKVCEVKESNISTGSVALIGVRHRDCMDSRAVIPDAAGHAQHQRGRVKHQDAWGCCCAPPDCDDPALLWTVVPDTDAGALPGFMTLMSTFCKQQPVLSKWPIRRGFPVPPSVDSAARRKRCSLHRSCLLITPGWQPSCS